MSTWTVSKTLGGKKDYLLQKRVIGDGEETGLRLDANEYLIETSTVQGVDINS